MKNMKKPLSPHLTIYKPQITSVLSISHRMTGIFQSFGLFFISLIILTIYLGDNVYSYFEPLFESMILKIFFIIYTFSLFYHLFNGIRHLLWDLGYGFSISNVTYSGYLIIILALSSNILLWLWF